MKEKLKLIVILGVEFAAIAIMLVLIFMAGKQQFTVTFDLNGGTLISGSVEQSVSQGGNATPPSVVKEGHYLLGWSGNYRSVTHDATVTAIWEYETTPGIEYQTHKTYSTISGCFKNLTGDVYIGAYHDDLMVLGIGDGAFKDCKRIENVFMLDGILTIGSSAFEACHSLDNIVLPSTTLTIGDRAFANCESLSSIVLPEDLEEIGAQAFAGCEQLEEINRPGGLQIIGAGAFENCTGLVSVTLPEGLTRLGDGAFVGCTELTEVYIPAGIEYIGASAFEGCEKLEKVVFLGEESDEDADGTVPKASSPAEPVGEPEVEPTLLVIGSRAFADCAALTEITLPESLTDLGAEAFAGCSLLEAVTLPEGLISIGDGAFRDCEALPEITLPESLTDLGTEVFNTEVTVKLPFTEAELPEGFTDGWYGEEVTVIYVIEDADGALAPDGEGENDAAE